MASDFVDRIVEVSAVRPGDVLIVRLSEYATREDLTATAEGLREGMPDSVKVLVIGGSDIELHVLRAAPTEGSPE
jgi:hypothetical protein